MAVIAAHRMMIAEAQVARPLARVVCTMDRGLPGMDQAAAQCRRIRNRIRSRNRSRNRSRSRFRYRFRYRFRLRLRLRFRSRKARTFPDRGPGTGA